ncbi:MAG: aspartyl beta-hydroxylase [Bacteroidetes bacterium]|nr:MAG: aspartyl beta-hydroxylase [Bacteroidota bacterium]PTM08794.1 MAG: aspartyl beta-hydroxylase [Bacteroidota bacterium]
MPTTSTASDRVKLPLSFDVARLQAEVANLRLHHYLYYDVLPLRSPAHLVDPSLPPPPPADDYADGSWTDWLDTPALQSAPYLTQVVDHFRQHTSVTLVRLLRLAPQAEVREHTDPTLGLEIHKSVIRLTIPVFTNDQVEFFLNNEIVPMQAGECWYLRLSDPHRINNHSEQERINLTIDMVPNDWVKALIVP